MPKTVMQGWKTAKPESLPKDTLTSKLINFQLATVRCQKYPTRENFAELLEVSRKVHKARKKLSDGYAKGTLKDRSGSPIVFPEATRTFIIDGDSDKGSLTSIMKIWMVKVTKKVNKSAQLTVQIIDEALASVEAFIQSPDVDSARAARKHFTEASGHLDAGGDDDASLIIRFTKIEGLLGDAISIYKGNGATASAKQKHMKELQDTLANLRADKAKLARESKQSTLMKEIIASSRRL
jgi:hypothetical protein